MAQRKRTRLTFMRMQVPSLASLSGSGIRRCPELWYRWKIRLGSRLAAAVVEAGSCSSVWTPSLGTSIRHRRGSKRQKKREEREKAKEKRIIDEYFWKIKIPSPLLDHNADLQQRGAALPQVSGDLTCVCMHVRVHVCARVRAPHLPLHILTWSVFLPPRGRWAFQLRILFPTRHCDSGKESSIHCSSSVSDTLCSTFHRISGSPFRRLCCH